MNQCSKCLFYDEEFDNMHQDDVVSEDSNEVHYCPAFPEGIPEEIWTDKVSHKKPYTGDHEIQFMDK